MPSTKRFNFFVYNLKNNRVRKVINVFRNDSREDFQCFGCSPYNERGLQLSFFESDGEVVAEWSPKRDFEGYTNVLHGGIQATLLDEIASWVVYTQCDTAGVTSGMNIRYKKPVYINGGVVKIKGRVESRTERKAIIKCELLNEKGQVCSNADVEYFLFPDKIAREKYHYPGKEAFFEMEEI
ncbi:PaaI family thioesterase [Marinilabiliaceae bacterium JC017]|nr:PaaI family thioesterase [Marinilabiliaceae bacterium JC017]